MLRFHGFAVATAGTAADALRLAERERPDVVVLDVMLPDGDGPPLIATRRGFGYVLSEEAA
nr:hypothetical protein GCM10020063_058950 [Dactylosporangium thailandense]